MTLLLPIDKQIMKTPDVEWNELLDLVWGAYENEVWFYDNYKSYGSSSQYLPVLTELFIEDEDIDRTILHHASYLLYGDENYAYSLEDEEEVENFYSNMDALSERYYDDTLRIFNYYKISYMEVNRRYKIINNPIVEVW